MLLKILFGALIILVLVMLCTVFVLVATELVRGGAPGWLAGRPRACEGARGGVWAESFEPLSERSN